MKNFPKMYVPIYQLFNFQTYLKFFNHNFRVTKFFYQKAKYH